MLFCTYKRKGGHIGLLGKAMSYFFVVGKKDYVLFVWLSHVWFFIHEVIIEFEAIFYLNGVFEHRAHFVCLRREAERKVAGTLRTYDELLNHRLSM